MGDAGKIKLKPDKRKRWRSWAFLATAGIATIVFGVYLYRVNTTHRADQVILAKTEPLLSLLTFVSQISLAGVEHTLLHGSENDRVSVLDQLAELDPTEIEDFPASVYHAVEANLDHESRQVREKATNTLDLIQSSPWHKGMK